MASDPPILCLPFSFRIISSCLVVSFPIWYAFCSAGRCLEFLIHFAFVSDPAVSWSSSSSIMPYRLAPRQSGLSVILPGSLIILLFPPVKLAVESSLPQVREVRTWFLSATMRGLSVSKPKGVPLLVN